MKMVNMTGQKFGRLLVIGPCERRRVWGISKIYWKARCDCGNVGFYYGDYLRNGDTKSCGCLHQEVRSKMNRTHGLSATPTFRIWCDMRRRCTNAKRRAFRRYGGRGIRVCDRWLKFENFVEDMGLRPRGMSLDRIDNNGNYEPSNCRWATRKQQTLNSPTTRWIEFGGERLCLTDWARKLGMTESGLHFRLKNWPMEKALTTPKIT